MAMTTFGTSAYLKLLGLNPQPRDTELRKRIWPTTDGGYDYHKAMRGIATGFASGSADWRTTKAALKAIKRPDERISATSATFALMRWVNGRSIRPVAIGEQKAQSPNALFSIKFTPDFELDLNGTLTRIHIWNTKKPLIRLREAIGTLGLFVSEESPHSIAILSLRTGELFVPTDYERAHKLAVLLAVDIEKRLTRISEEGGKRRPKYPLEKRTVRF